MHKEQFLNPLGEKTIPYTLSLEDVAKFYSPDAPDRFMRTLNYGLDRRPLARYAANHIRPFYKPGNAPYGAAGSMNIKTGDIGLANREMLEKYQPAVPGSGATVGDIAAETLLHELEHAGSRGTTGVRYWDEGDRGYGDHLHQQYVGAEPYKDMYDSWSERAYIEAERSLQDDIALRAMNAGINPDRYIMDVQGNRVALPNNLLPYSPAKGFGTLPEIEKQRVIARGDQNRGYAVYSPDKYDVNGGMSMYLRGAYKDAPNQIRNPELMNRVLHPSLLDRIRGGFNGLLAKAPDAEPLGLSTYQKPLPESNLIKTPVPGMPEPNFNPPIETSLGGYVGYDPEWQPIVNTSVQGAENGGAELLPKGPRTLHQYQKPLPESNLIKPPTPGMPEPNFNPPIDLGSGGYVGYDPKWSEPMANTSIQGAEGRVNSPPAPKNNYVVPGIAKPEPRSTTSLGDIYSNIGLPPNLRGTKEEALNKLEAGKGYVYPNVLNDSVRIQGSSSMEEARRKQAEGRGFHYGSFFNWGKPEPEKPLSQYQKPLPESAMFKPTPMFKPNQFVFGAHPMNQSTEYQGPNAPLPDWGSNVPAAKPAGEMPSGAGEYGAADAARQFYGDRQQVQAARNQEVAGGSMRHWTDANGGKHWGVGTPTPHVLGTETVTQRFDKYGKPVV